MALFGLGTEVSNIQNIQPLCAKTVKLRKLEVNFAQLVVFAEYFFNSRFADKIFQLIPYQLLKKWIRAMLSEETRGVLFPDFSVRRLLGPNGAGKTTTISIISTLMLPTDGEVRLNGELLDRNKIGLKKQISLITQEYSLRRDMTVEEVMDLHGRLFGMPRSERKRKTNELLEFGGLLDHRKRIARELSGGMKRKLMLCRALMTDPKLLLLDEPTVGMDPVARSHTWDMIRYLIDDGVSVLLTTHYIEEAHSLCGRVAFMSSGSIKVCEKPDELINRVGSFAIDEKVDHAVKSHYFTSREDAAKFASGLYSYYTLRDTTLEDAYLQYVGKRLG